MFCTKCGHQCADNEQFCCNCGESLNIAECQGQATALKAVSISEYFSNYCSTNAKKRQRIIKILGAVSLGIQAILAILSVISILYSMMLFKALGATRFFVLALILLIAFTVPSFIFTVKGISKKSPGFLIASSFFAVIAGAFGSGFAINIVTVNRIVACVILILHIAMIVLNSKNIKEYKKIQHFR